jgi:hypothetical protein
MMTSVRYSVSWCYREGGKTVRRIFYSAKTKPCVEAGRLIDDNPFAFDIEVIEADTGRMVEWKAPSIGTVLVRA